MKTTMKTRIILLLAAVALFGVYACAHTASLAVHHPIELTAPPLCSDCHQDWRTSLDHTSDYIKRHRFYAEQKSQACLVCHKESFCSDCHAHRDELKPSDKYKDSPERWLPHRGDYLNQHKIDGRINPASCMKCHGRSNNERCRVCHK
jgi:hypothetical protein